MDQTIIDQILNADARALATTGPHGINVVPVSVIEVEAGIIYLFNFFMDKTVANLTVNTAVALTCWKGLEGVQLKGTVSYLTSGDRFEEKTKTMRERFPTRTLSGIIALTPAAVFDVSADKNRAGKALFSG